MMDIHSHILPGLDDGSDSIETSLEMLKLACEKDIDSIIATPHYRRGNFTSDYNQVEKAVEELNKRAEEEDIPIKVLPGQEVLLDKQSIKLYREGVIGGLAGSKYMLVELPFTQLPKDSLDIIYELMLLGAVPILAHPERYKYFIEKPHLINAFGEEGCLFQINTGSLRGVFGKEVRESATKFIEHGYCNFIASDAHGTKTRAPGIVDVIEEVKDIRGRVYYDSIFNSHILMSNGDINYDYIKIEEKKRRFHFFKKSK